MQQSKHALLALTQATQESHLETENLRQRLLSFAGPGSNQLPLLLFILMSIFFFLTSIVMPLRGLYFYIAFPDTRFGAFLLRPTQLIFPGKDIMWSVHYAGVLPATPSVAWKETLLLMVCFVALFAVYFLALFFIATRVRLRFILVTTTFMGLLGVFFPSITSQDIFSYIAYARLGVLYHMNPLTAQPIAIPADPIYPYLFWVHQPSAYGPTWAIITCALQSLTSLLGAGGILPMILLLRMLGLTVHLASVLLVWQICGSLQQMNGRVLPQKRAIATLAFAWNPLLIIEAAVNAHNDTFILFLILLAIWYLRPGKQDGRQPYIAAAFLLAVAACLKITMVVLFPGLLLFLWWQQPRKLYSIMNAVLVYGVTVVLLYLPFWDRGAILHVFQVNPGITRDINSPYEFLTHLYESLHGRPFPYLTPDQGAPIEIMTHKLSMLIFLALYGIIYIRTLIRPGSMRSLSAFIRWMALVWLLYCFVGSPWLWPWYLTVFFGLFALLEGSDTYWRSLTNVLHLPAAVRLLAFTLLCLYVFSTWGPHEKLVPGLPHFQFTYLRGLWVCLIPLLALRPPALLPAFQHYLATFSKTLERFSSLRLKPR